MSDDDVLDRFARALMTRVRDRAIAECDRLAAGGAVGPSGERWRGLVGDDDVRKALSELIPDIVDQVLFELLDAADHDELALGWRADGQQFASLEQLGAGEMSGDLMRSEGWRAQFSEQRFFDPFGDLRLDLGDDSADE